MRIPAKGGLRISSGLFCDLAGRRGSLPRSVVRVLTESGSQGGLVIGTCMGGGRGCNGAVVFTSQ